MPLRPAYKICPGDRIEVEVVQPDGGRALVVGKLDAVAAARGIETRQKVYASTLSLRQEKCRGPRGSGRPRPAREADLGLTRQSPASMSARRGFAHLTD